jgi:hypothetical protein
MGIHPVRQRGPLDCHEGTAVEQFIGLGRSRRLALAGNIGELLEVVSDEDAPIRDPVTGPQQPVRPEPGLYAPEKIKAVFELRLMCLSGYAPFLTAAPAAARRPGGPQTRAGRRQPSLRRLSLQRARRIAAAGRQSLAALRYIAQAEPKKIFAST